MLTVRVHSQAAVEDLKDALRKVEKARNKLSDGDPISSKVIGQLNRTQLNVVISRVCSARYNRCRVSNLIQHFQRWRLDDVWGRRRWARPTGA